MRCSQLCQPVQQTTDYCASLCYVTRRLVYSTSQQNFNSSQDQKKTPGWQLGTKWR